MHSSIKCSGRRLLPPTKYKPFSLIMAFACAVNTSELFLLLYLAPAVENEGLIVYTENVSLMEKHLRLKWQITSLQISAQRECLLPSV